VCIGWSTNGTQRKGRQQPPILVWPLSRNDGPFILDTHRPNESGMARPQFSSACVEGHASVRLSLADKKDNKTKGIRELRSEVRTSEIQIGLEVAADHRSFA